MSLADIIQIIIGILTFIATITVSFVIYWLQRRHEKQLRSFEEKQKQKELEEKAKLFLMDNERERDYLPWCVIAANLHRLEKHTRNIYTAYCRCPIELQNEILKQAGFLIEQIVETKWVEEYFEFLKKDIKAYHLGRDYLYDRAKYFRRGYERYRTLRWNNTPCIFEPICKENKFRKILKIEKIDISSYIDEYFYYFIDRKIDLKETEPQPPIDYVWDSQGLATAKEAVVCMWIIELVNDIAIMIPNNLNNTICLDYTDAVAETYEDKYYQALQSLYNAYHTEQPTQSKRKVWLRILKLLKIHHKSNRSK